MVTIGRRNTSVDWDEVGEVRALSPSRIRCLLVKYCYSPDKQECTIALVMDQTERLAAEAVA